MKIVYNGNLATVYLKSRLYGLQLIDCNVWLID